MPKIYFTSGKTIEISGKEYSKMAPRMQASGVRLYRTSKGDFIPLNSNTMELIELGEPEAMPKEVAPSPEPMKPTKAEVEVMVEKVEKQETREDEQQRLLEEITAKSDCVHEEKEIYKQSTTKGDRWFPVCTFCGKRDRFVKADSLTPAEKLNAKVWQED